jgi:hypothetical protein
MEFLIPQNNKSTSSYKMKIGLKEYDLKIGMEDLRPCGDK